MENRFRAIVSSNRPIEPRGVQIGEDVRLARAAAEEFFLMGMPRVNVLLAGRDEVVRLVLRTLLGHVPKPIALWSPGDTLALPEIEQPNTLVFREIGSLGLREQIQMLEWSSRAMRNTQVISTTSVPLLPRVAAGGFIDTLYYRLNTVYLDVTELGDAA